MKRVLSLLLTLALALALAVSASAAGEDIGIIGGADGPTYIFVSADPKAAATVSKEQREQNIKALGGTVGMYSFHHKTLHKSFAIGFPLLTIVQIAAVAYLIIKFA